MNNVPESWCWSKLIEICEIKTGKKDVNEGNPTGSYNFFTCASEPLKSDTYSFDGESILLPGNGANVGLSLYYNGKFEAYQRTYVLSGFQVYGKFIFYYLQAFWKPSLQDKQYGSATNYIRLGNITDFDILIPPANEQRRIVAKLEKLLAKVDAGKERLDKIPAILKRFRQSVLAAACSGRLTADWRENNPDVEPAKYRLERIKSARLGLAKSKADTQKILKSFEYSEANLNTFVDDWVALTAECLCDFITKGTTPDTKLISEIGDIPYLKVQHIVNNRINFYSLPCFVSRQVHENFLKRSKVFPRDVLMNIVGPPLNKVAIIPNDFPEWNINQALAIFRTVEGIIPEYLFLILSYEGTLEDILRETKGIVGQSNISLEQCRKLKILVPPLLEQQEIVRRVETLFKTVDQIEQRYQKARTYIDQLTQSILAKAFRGELVPQDPNDEPASVLLERIRAEREKRENVAKTAKKPAGKKGGRGRKKPEQQELKPVQLESPLLE